MDIKKILGKILNHELKGQDSYNYKPNKSMLFKEYFINYLIGREGESRSRSYSITLTMAIHIINGLGNYKMEDINKDVLKRFINQFASTKYEKSPKTHEMEYYSQSTINKVYNLLHGAIKEASSADGDKLLRIDYMSNIKKTRSKRMDTNTIKAFSANDVHSLLEIVCENSMIYVWVYIMLYTGVRPSEALALKFSDINYTEKTVEITKTLSQEDFYDAEHLVKLKPSQPIITNLKNERGSEKVNWQRRTLKVSDRLLAVLKLWEVHIKGDEKMMSMKRANGTEDYLFCGSHGQLWLYEYYSQVYKRLLKKHGLKYSDFHPYRFRHTYCTQLFRMNVNIKAAQLIMGDNTPEMVMQVYANLDKSDVLNGSESLAKSLDVSFDIPKGLSQRDSDILSQIHTDRHCLPVVV